MKCMKCMKCMKRNRVSFASLLLACLLPVSLPAIAQGPAYPYSVALTFTASTGTVTGYNMYRAPYTTACGTFVKLNSTPFTATAYTDANPPQGTYCYAATALDGVVESGLSAAYSNVGIPPPPPTSLGASVAKTNGTTGQVTWAWTQSKGTGLLDNELACGKASGGPYTERWVGKPATSIKLSMTAPGPHYCVVAAIGKTGTSGPSNQAVARP